MPKTPPAPPPVEGILTVLDEGKASGTHKFVLLLALIDIAATSTVPHVSYDTIADKVVELCWDHVLPFGPTPIAQGPQGDPYFIQAAGRLRVMAGGCAYPLVPDSLRATPPWQRVIRRLATQLAGMPIRRLQNLAGETEVPFLYQRDDTNRHITYLPGAREDLTRFGPVLRPLVESRIVRFVIGIRRNPFGGAVEEQVRTHLFGAERHMPRDVLRSALIDLQGGKCIWTGQAITLRSPADHVLPWARLRLSAIENFVIAEPIANSSKSNLLLAPTMTRRWLEHITAHRTTLAALATAGSWPTNPTQVLDAYRLQVQRAPDGAPLWDGPSKPPVPLDDTVRTATTDLLAAAAS